MQAEIKRIYSPDVEDLKAFFPNEKERFMFLLQMIVGPRNQEGEESFDMIVCTPSWLQKNHSKSDILFGRHYLIVLEYNYQDIFNKLNDYVNNIERSTWDEICEIIGRIGQWEFEDYQPVDS